MDNYIKRLESVINPNTYNLNNYKEKIIDNNKKALNNNQSNYSSSQHPTNNNNGYSNFNFTNSNNMGYSDMTMTNGNNNNNNLGSSSLFGNKANVMTFNANSNNNNIMNENQNNNNTIANNVNLSNIPNLNSNNNTVEFQLNLDKNNLYSEENKKLIEEYIQRMGIKDLLESSSSNPNIINESKMRIYQKILEREGKLENPEDLLNSYAENEILNTQNLNNINSVSLHEQLQDNNNIKNNSNNNNVDMSDPIKKFKQPNPNQNSTFNNNNNNNYNYNNNNYNENNYNNNYSNSINHKQNFNVLINHNNNASMASNSRKGLELHNLNSQNTLNASKNLSVSPSHKYKQLSYASGASGENVSTEREKIHILNIKAMNYRHEVETLKKRINELSKVVEDQKEKILRIEKQKENDNKYLLKLENLLAAQSTAQPPSLNAFLNSSAAANLNNVSSLSNASQRNFTNGIFVELRKCSNLIVKDKNHNFTLNLTDQAEMKEFILNLMNEAQKLKAFQKQVFEISKNYDDINENMIDSIKTIQNIMDISSAKNIDDIEKKEIYCKLIIALIYSLLSYYLIFILSII